MKNINVHMHIRVHAGHATNAFKEIEWREEDAEKWLGSPPLIEMVCLK